MSTLAAASPLIERQRDLVRTRQKLAEFADERSEKLSSLRDRRAELGRE